MSHHKLAWLCLAAFGLAITLAPAGAEAGTWYVNATAGDTANDGLGAGTAKKYLGHLFRGSLADTLLVLAGDTVLVAAGTYSETISIDTDNIAIVGADSRTTTINFGDSSTARQAYGIRADSQTGLVLRQLGFSNNNEGIRWQAVVNSSIEGCSLAFNADFAIDLYDCTSIVVDGNNVYRNGIGIYVFDCRQTTVSNNHSDNNENDGMLIDYCPGGDITITGNTFSSNGYIGLQMVANVDSAYVGNNVAAGNALDGFTAGLSNRQVFERNTSSGNVGVGFYISSNILPGDSYVFIRNISTNNDTGFALSGTENACLWQNQADSNRHCAYEFDSCAADTLAKNNFSRTPAQNDLAAWSRPNNSSLDLRRNWWGTTDSAAISALLQGPGKNSLQWVPYRLGRVDTAANADTIAPAAPAGVAAWARNGACTVTWSASAANEEIGGGAPGDLAGYRVYRAGSSDTSYWAPIGTTGVGVTAYCDTTILADTFYYYRITAYDNHAPWPNESWYSEIAGVIDAPGANAWYVNDTQAANDTLCSAVGADVNHGFSPDRPKLSLATIFSQLSAGDTVYIDAGWYAPPATLTCSGVNYLWIIGADSRYTRIDAQQHWDTVMFMRNMTGLYVANIEFSNAMFDGINGAGLSLDSVSAALIDNDSFTGNDVGLVIKSGSDSATVRGCYFTNMGATAVELYSSVRTAISGSRFNVFGVLLYPGADSTVFANNQMTGNVMQAMNCAGGSIIGNTFTSATLNLSWGSAGCTSFTVANNTVSSGKITVDDGSFNCFITGNNINYVSDHCLEVSGDSNYVGGNTLTGAGAAGRGLTLWDGGDSNIVTGNNISGKRNYGILVQSDGNRIDTNLITNCQDGGIFIQASGETNTLRGNTMVSCGDGMIIDGYNNLIERNVARTGMVAAHGFNISGQRNTLAQNYADSNSGYGMSIAATAAPNTYEKNIIVPSAARPDSGVLCDTTAGVDLRRTYWNTTDSATVYQRLRGAGRATVLYSPFRLGSIDTGAGADSIAPAAPLSLTVSGTGILACTLAWSAATTNEEVGGGLADLAGYRVYRSRTGDTSYWSAIGTTAAGDTDYVDTAVDYTTYYYRVTAYDNHAPWPNESWYSDSTASANLLPDTSGANAWYVNDTATAGDTFTTSVGNDAYLGLSPAYPKRTLGALEALLTAGDTVYIDCGTYVEPDSIIIASDGIFIIGKDSAATVIDLGSQAFAQKRALCAVNVAYLTLRDFRLTNGYNGLWFRNVDTSTVTRVTADSQGNCGFLLDTASGSGSDSNTFTANCAAWNSSDGFDFFSSRNNDMSANSAEGNWIGFCLASSPGNRLTGNTITQSTTNGVTLQSSASATLTGNSCLGNGADGIYLNGSDTCTLTANTCADNGGSGICLQAAHGNTLTANTLTGNDAGVSVNYANNNTLVANYARSNYSGGFMLNDNGAGLGANGNRFYQNVADSNAGYGFSIGNSGTPVSAGDTFSKNLIITAPYAAYIDSGVRNLTANQFDFTRNWWVRGGAVTTDSTAIRGMCGGSGAGLLARMPYRFARIDTTAGADTIAPAAPDSVTVGDSSLANTACTIVWTAANTNEEIGGALGDLAGYRVYRSRTSDTSYWALVGSTALTSLVDSGLVAGETYYYRITAYDNHSPWPNESWYSDSLVSVVITPKTGDFVHAGASANVVDAADLAYLNAQVALYWGAAPADSRCDLDSNGILDFDDIALFALFFGG